MPPFMLLPYHPFPKQPVTTTLANEPSSSADDTGATPEIHPQSGFLHRSFSLSTIPELDSASSSVCSSAPSPELLTPQETPEASVYAKQAAHERGLGWLSSLLGLKKSTASATKVSTSAARVTIENLPSVKTTHSFTTSRSAQHGEADTIPCCLEAPISHSDVSTLDLDALSSVSSDSDDSSDESSTWSAIIPREVYYAKTWIAGTRCEAKAQQQYALKDGSLGLLRAETENEKVERMDEWFSKSDLTVGGTHRLIKHLMCHSSPTTHVEKRTCKAEKQPIKRQKSTIALRQILSQIDLQALQASWNEDDAWSGDAWTY
ncbi:hypothetical protein L198_05931 [Cryptococcus wingfieldii CBS 7118]|uniref:Uncharacterized protein n=1 Tax=Cryptococcus wingfieldii CBS 7118 TaxID=1295528 RepID=A0A1E3IS29_9TREE|nr:hypothetical protein L198_05931 [Cryptococcus wingfieldii CBS 7118]ODN91417.1 hypothetical protein L198_05931 [Cryptococcus wingfieldii CBS 7118]